MLNCRIFLILFTLSFLILSKSLPAADFNIKLRKTDINDLKQQLMPAFEQNIQVLQALLLCLEQGKKTDVCLEQLTITSEFDKQNQHSDKQNQYKERQEQITQNLKKKINDNNIDQKQIISELKKLLNEAEKVRQCLNHGQTANEIKNCVMQP